MLLTDFLPTCESGESPIDQFPQFRDLSRASAVLKRITSLCPDMPRVKPIDAPDIEE